MDQNQPPELPRDPLNPYSLWPKGYDPLAQLLPAPLPPQQSSVRWSALRRIVARLPLRNDAVKVVLMVVAIGLVALCGAGAVVLAVPPGSSRTAGTSLVVATAAAPTPTPWPSATPPPTATPLPTQSPTPSGPKIVSGAYLGGTADAFTAAYGQPSTAYGRSTYVLTTPDGITVQVCYCTTTSGIDGQPRVNTLSLSSTSAGWTQQMALNIFTRFYPPHSTHVSDFTDPQIGPIHVYQSADLAQTFPASAFTNSGGVGTLPPGTFSVACEDPNYVACTMVVGE